MKTKFNTWLPLFDGFYCSYWDDLPIDSEVEYIDMYGIKKSKFITYFFKNSDDISKFIWDNLNIDVFYKDLSADFCRILESEINDIFEDLEIEIKFESLKSPKEYNFHNDSIDCEISLNLSVFKKWIYENKDFINNELKNRYKPRDGFIPYYGDSFEEWKNDTSNFNNLGGHFLGALLDIFCVKEGITSDIFYTTEIHFSVYVSYDKLKEWADENNVELVEVFHDPNQLEFNI